VKKIKEHGAAVKISGLQLRTFREVALYFEPDIDTHVDAEGGCTTVFLRELSPW
jgi:hypothetical protein